MSVLKVDELYFLLLVRGPFITVSIECLLMAWFFAQGNNNFRKPLTALFGIMALHFASLALVADQSHKAESITMLFTAPVMSLILGWVLWTLQVGKWLKEALKWLTERF